MKNLNKRGLAALLAVIALCGQSALQADVGGTKSAAARKQAADNAAAEVVENKAEEASVTPAPTAGYHGQMLDRSSGGGVKMGGYKKGAKGGAPLSAAQLEAEKRAAGKSWTPAQEAALEAAQKRAEGAEHRK